MSNLFVHDIGFLLNKLVVDNNQPFMFKSIVGIGRKLQLQDLNIPVEGKKNKDQLICNLGDDIYFVSDLAISECETVFYSLKPNRFDSVATKVLLNTGLALGLGGGYHDNVYAVSGLPLDHYNKFKKDLENLFVANGKVVHEYEVISKSQTIKGSARFVDARFIPQPFGVLVDIILNDNGDIADTERCAKTIAIVDVGFGTTDVYVSKMLSPVERLSFSTPTAMNHAYSLIAERVSQYDASLPLYKIEDIVQTNRFSAYGKSYNMEKTVDWAMEQTGIQLVSELFNKWKNIHEIDEIYIAGGGGIRIAKHVIPEFNNIYLSPNAQTSVARGYRKWGRRIWKGVV